MNAEKAIFEISVSKHQDGKSEIKVISNIIKKSYLLLLILIDVFNYHDENLKSDNKIGLE